jgi:hypothetical protein
MSIQNYYDYEWTVDGKAIDFETFAITKDTTFKVLWSPKEYTIYYNYLTESEKEEIENLDAGYQAAAEARADIEAMSNTAIPKMYNSAAVETNATVQENSADPDAYRRAWLKNMAHDEKTGRWMIGEMTPEEMNAFTFTTANTDDLVPKPL